MGSSFVEDRPWQKTCLRASMRGPISSPYLVLLLAAALVVTGQGSSQRLAEDLTGRRRNLKSASFLAARVLPVDAYKIRNSLFLSQLLRMPAAAAINVVENEDAARIYEESKYKAMEGQTARLDKTLENGLLLLAKPP